jgi:hypothetical protein
MKHNGDNGMGYDLDFTNFKYLNIKLTEEYEIKDDWVRTMGISKFRGIDVIGESSKAVKLKTETGEIIIPKTAIKGEE